MTTTTTTRNLEHDACLAISKKYGYGLNDLWSKPLRSETAVLVEETTNGTAWHVEAKGKKLFISEV